MKLLSFLHRWAGGLIGLLLALLGLSGAILVWEGEWVQLPGVNDPLAENVSAIAAVVDRARESGPLERVTFASEEIGLHHLTFGGGAGAYVRQDGRPVESWSSMWERPELWLFDFHHHLFAGHTGEIVAGVAGIAGLLFVVTGVILWWRSRRAFAPRLWPKRFAPGPIVSHHRDLGLVTAPLLLLSMITGSLMIFEPLRNGLLGAEERPKTEAAQAPGNSSVAALLEAAKARFPEADLRRISFPGEAGKPILLRLRQPFEWTPNGRTELAFDSRTGALLWVEDAASANRSARIAEKLYPLHSAKVGGIGYKLLMTVSGLALFLLGSLATYGFWMRRAAKASAARRRGRGGAVRLPAAG